MGAVHGGLTRGRGGAGGFTGAGDVCWRRTTLSGQWVTRWAAAHVAYAREFNVSLRRRACAPLPALPGAECHPLTAVTPPTYAAALLTLTARRLALLSPTHEAVPWPRAVVLGKVVVDLAAFRALRPQLVSWRCAPAAQYDGAMFIAWWHASSSARWIEAHACGSVPGRVSSPPRYVPPTRRWHRGI